MQLVPLLSRPSISQNAESLQQINLSRSAYQALLEQQGFLCSMNRKGDCYDNAAMESFFHTLKVEQVHGARYPTREAAKAEVFDYIETYYNPKRRHSTLNYQSPWEFEKRMAA